MDRRGFLKSLLAVGAVAVAGSAVVAEAELPWLDEFLRTGVLVNQTIYLDKPLVLGNGDFLIRNCRFIARREMPYMVYLEKTASQGIMNGCCFDGAGLVAWGR